jgi:hypothetical protein
MSSNLLQISSQFTEDFIATSASPCERLECTTIIQPGEKRFYVAPHGRPDKPGKHICEPCMVYYLKKPSTTARVVPTVQAAVVGSDGNLLFLKIVVGANFLTDTTPRTTGSRPKTHRQVMGAPPNPTPGSSGNVIDMASIRSLINESQRRGMSSLKTNLDVQ